MGLAEYKDILKKITIPDLESLSGDNIRDAFKSIDRNFERLAQLDFIKGDSGDSMFIEEIELIEHTDWMSTIQETILKLHLDTDGKPVGDNFIGEYDIFYNFIREPGKIYAIYKFNENTNEKKYISSLPYTFLDARFNKENLVQFSQTEDYANDYIDAIDYSCTLYMGEDGKWNVVQNFPILYYDNDLGFCWKINGNETGISAQGPEGRSGTDGQVFIVMVDYYDDNGNIKTPYKDNMYEVLSVMNTMGEFVPVSDSDLRNKYGNAVMAIPNIPDLLSSLNDEVLGYPLWITYALKYENTHIVACDDKLMISNVTTTNSLKKIFNQICIDGAGLKGYYIPIDKADPTKDTKSAHMIYASKVKNTAETYNKLNISPVSDINNPGTTIGNTILNVDYTNINLNGNTTIDGDFVVNYGNSSKTDISSGEVTLNGNRGTIKLCKDLKEPSIIIDAADVALPDITYSEYIPQCVKNGYYSEKRGEEDVWHSNTMNGFIGKNTRKNITILNTYEYNYNDVFSNIDDVLEHKNVTLPSLNIHSYVQQKYSYKSNYEAPYDFHRFIWHLIMRFGNGSIYRPFDPFKNMITTQVKTAPYPFVTPGGGGGYELVYKRADFPEFTFSIPQGQIKINLINVKQYKSTVVNGELIDEPVVIYKLLATGRLLCEFNDSMVGMPSSWTGDYCDLKILYNVIIKSPTLMDDGETYKYNIIISTNDNESYYIRLFGNGGLESNNFWKSSTGNMSFTFDDASTVIHPDGEECIIDLTSKVNIFE